MNSDYRRKSQGHINARKRLEKKQNSLNVLLSDSEKAIVLKILGKDQCGKKQKHSYNNKEQVVSEKVTNTSKNTPNKKDEKSLITLLSGKDILTVWNICGYSFKEEK